MIGHPMQMGITVLVIMGLCGIAGHMITDNGTWAAWLFFAALFLLVFGIFMPSHTTYQRSRRRY
jgi:hypothetical protein